MFDHLGYLFAVGFLAACSLAVDVSGTTNEVITLGAGCFWCTEAVFQQIPGVIPVEPGYMGIR